MALPSQTLNGLSLCTGVGGLELGLHIAEPAYRTVCYIERQAYAAATLVARMEDAALSDAPVWSDVKTFDGRRFRGCVDVLSAGYPCQPFSAAGKRRGTDDPRHLWPHVARIIDEVQPEWVFLENVEGHVSVGFDLVARELCAMGFDVEAGLFSAAEVGASHWRKRLFILAHANCCELRQPAGIAPVADRSSGHHADGSGGQPGGPEGDGRGMDAAMAVYQGGGADADGSDELALFAPAPLAYSAWYSALVRQPHLQPCLYGLDDGVADGLERLAAAGNGVVPLAAALAWRTLKARFHA